MVKLRIRGFEAAPIWLACGVSWLVLAPIAAIAQPYPVKPELPTSAEQGLGKLLAVNWFREGVRRAC